MSKIRPFNTLWYWYRRKLKKEIVTGNLPIF